MIELFSPKDKLPKNKQYVLAYFPRNTWADSDAVNDEHKWVVVKFVRGISMAERGSLPDSDERKKMYSAGDEWANNHVPYCWLPFGPGSFFGQEAELWGELPDRPTSAQSQPDIQGKQPWLGNRIVVRRRHR